MNILHSVCLIIICGCTGALIGSTLAEVYWTIRKARLKKKILDARDAQGDWLEGECGPSKEKTKQKNDMP